jgi:hypothetical protein
MGKKGLVTAGLITALAGGLIAYSSSNIGKRAIENYGISRSIENLKGDALSYDFRADSFVNLMYRIRKNGIEEKLSDNELGYIESFLREENPRTRQTFLFDRLDYAEETLQKEIYNSSPFSQERIDKLRRPIEAVDYAFKLLENYPDNPPEKTTGFIMMPREELDIFFTNRVMLIFDSISKSQTYRSIQGI